MTHADETTPIETEGAGSGSGSKKKTAKKPRTTKKTTKKKTAKKKTTKKAASKKKTAKPSASKKKTKKKPSKKTTSRAAAAAPEAEPAAPVDTDTEAEVEAAIEVETVAEAGGPAPVAESEREPASERSRAAREGDGAGEAEGEGDGPPRKKRRRRRRRRKGGPSAEGAESAGTAGDRAASAGGEAASEDAAIDARPKRPVAPSKGEIEHWEEIFEERTFADLGLRNSVLAGIDKAGFRHPTKIQGELIPMMLSGKDVLGQSRTGTGKTAAFGLPLFNNATRNLAFQTFILAPTRELAIQIARELTDLGQFTPIKVCAVYGGSSMDKQRRQLERGPEIIVATPGRLWDVYQRGMLHFNNVKFVVLDEVDRMLDIGFRDDIKQILRQVKTEHQTVFVSATISEEIERLARTFMQDPDRIVTTGSSLTVSLVQQFYVSVNHWDKKRMLHHLLTHEEQDLTLVFCNMKRTVDSVVRFLERKGVESHAIHGDLPQGKRNAIMNRLRGGQLEVLIASDLAARGLDVEGISHVVNYDLPDDPEIYIHRVGRSARAGRNGVAWALVTPEDGGRLTEIEKLANVHIPEKVYPDFKGGEPPATIREARAAEDKRIETAKSRSRFKTTSPASWSLPKDVADAKFPDGTVPSRLPPRRLGGRAKTARSMKTAAKPPVVEDGDAAS